MSGAIDEAQTDPERLDQVPTTGTVELPPDPRSLEALGRHHTFEAAVAELVDNSLDAKARHIVVRFVRDGHRLVRLHVADDGAGIDGSSIDVAMTVGGARQYEDGEIGRFGLGLKAASFSQAASVTVVSRAASALPVGRRWTLEKAKRDYRCEIVDDGFAQAQLEEDWGFPPSATGTVVRWDEVRGFPHAAAAPPIEQFLQATIARVRLHLGLIFHRHLERGDAQIAIDVWDIEDGEVMRRVSRPWIRSDTPARERRDGQRLSGQAAEGPSCS